MKKLFWLRLLLMAVVMTVSATAYAEDQYGFYYNEYVKPTDTLNVRSGAGTSYSVVGTVLSGQAGLVIGGPTYNNGYYWWYIQWPVQGYSGWSVQNYLELYNERDEEDYSTGYVEVNGDGSGNLNTRFSAGVDQQILESYPEGTVGEIVGGPTHLHGYVWWRIAWPDSTIGWSVQRYVDEASEPVQDTTPPVITRLGDTIVEVSYNGSYTDAGATAWDDVDGDITQDIVVTGLPVNTSVVGNHYIWYNVADEAGNDAQAKARVVSVLPQGSPPVEGDAVIFGNTIGNGWSINTWYVTASESAGQLEVSFNAALGELNFSTESFGTTGYNTLSFYIKSSNANEQLYVHLHDANGNAIWSGHVYLPSYSINGLLYTDVWQELHIPLDDLYGVDTTITGVTFVNDYSSNIMIDELRFSSFSENGTGGCDEN